MTTTALILTGIGFGLGAAVPIGPVNVELARRTLKQGPAAGIALGCGAVTIDVIFAVVSSLGVNAALERHPRIGLAISVVGIAVLLYLAFLSLRSAWRAYCSRESEKIDDVPLSARTMVGSYAAGFAMTGLNPYTWLWWLTVLPGFAQSMHVRQSWDLPMICVGVFIGTLAWVLFFVALLTSVRRFAGRAWHVTADTLGGVMLLGFAIAALWRSVGRPL
jgi:L-lysine exporter family protein LysE/ArgO